MTVVTLRYQWRWIEPRMHLTRLVAAQWRRQGKARNCWHVGVAARLCGLGRLSWLYEIIDMNGVSVVQKIQTLFIDELVCSEAEGTFCFGLDGAEYEPDRT